MSNRLDPDQARQFVGPDLGPICLQRLSADVTTMAGTQSKIALPTCDKYNISWTGPSTFQVKKNACQCQPSRGESHGST